MLRSFEHLWGLTLAASDGEVGKVQDMYFDDQEWTVRYLVIATGSWLSERDHLIAPCAISRIREREGIVEARLTQEQVLHSPPVETGVPVSREYEELFHRHYGWAPYWTTIKAVAGVWEQAPDLACTDASECGPAKECSNPVCDLQLWGWYQLCGYTLHEEDGERGHVEDLIIDDHDWRVRYIVVGTGRWLPGKRVLLSTEWVEKICFDENEVYVKLPRASLKNAPRYSPGEPISRDLELRLNEHYHGYA